MMQQTSLKAYREVKKRGLGPRQQQVLDTLKVHGAMTNLEIAKVLGREINTVTPRMNELVKQGLVYCSEIRPCKHTGRKANVWSLW